VARPGDRRVVPFPVERVQAAAAPPAVADTRAPAPRRNGHALALVALVVVLNLTGLVMVLSASAAASQETYGTPWYQFQRQLLWLGLGTAALLVVTRIDLQRLRRPATTILAVTVGLLVAVLVPGLGTNVNGSSRWLGAGPVSIQPSELAKLALVLFVADLLARRARRVHDLRLTLRPVLVVFGLVAALVMLQPNLGTTMLLFAIVVSMLFVAGVPGKPLALTAGVGVAVAGLFALAEPYRFRRLLAFTDPWADPLNTGYQTLQSRAALANGGTVGQGLGQGRAKFGFLPEGHTDFIFANIGEELGLIGALVLLGLFVAVAVVGMSVAMRAPDRFGTLVAAGVTTWILAQAFVNLGAVVGVLPITGVPLPFVSFGGSSLVVTMAAYGMLLHVARQLR
jgi:cell division protein FtsW